MCDTTSPKYELGPRNPLTGLHRIKALRDLPECGVKAGDVGGWIGSEKNLARVYGDAWVYGDARVSGDAQVSGNARVSGNAQVYGDAQVSGNAQVSGDAQVSGNARVYGDAQVYGDAWVYGDARVSGNAQVYGDAQVSGDAQVEKPIHTYGISGPITPNATHATLMRLKGGKHLIQVGCWSGTVKQLRALAASDQWPSGGNEAYRDQWRQSLLDVADLFATRKKLWKGDA